MRKFGSGFRKWADRSPLASGATKVPNSLCCHFPQPKEKIQNPSIYNLRMLSYKKLVPSNVAFLLRKLTQTTNQLSKNCLQTTKNNFFLALSDRFSRSEDYWGDHQTGFDGRGHRCPRRTGEQVAAAAKRCEILSLCS